MPVNSPIGYTVGAAAPPIWARPDPALGAAGVEAGALALSEYGALWAFAASRYDLNAPVYTSQSGPYIPVDLTTRLILLGIATILAVTIVRRAQRLLYLASRDRLTGLYNRG